MVVDDRGAGAERGAGEVVLDEAVDADGGGGVAELDAGEEDEGDGEGRGDGGQQLAGGRHGSRLPAAGSRQGRAGETTRGARCRCRCRRRCVFALLAAFNNQQPQLLHTLPNMINF